MIDPELKEKLDELGAKIDAMREVAEFTRKYLFWRVIIVTALILLPIIGLYFTVPNFLADYVNALRGFGL